MGVYDRGEADGQLWISMDFVDGLDAARLLVDRYPAGMPVDEVVRIVGAVASGLDYAHKQGLLHRDVKPANILLTHLDDDGEQRILLTDFGIARNLDDISGLTTTNLTVRTRKKRWLTGDWGRRTASTVSGRRAFRWSVRRMRWSCWGHWAQ